jgi:hypothetical protein
MLARMPANRKKSFERMLAEFRRMVALHRAEGATEEHIRRLLGASMWVAIQGIDDVTVRAWVCDEFTKAARSVPIANCNPVSWTVH